ncbi:MAG TPA: methyltransferase [Salinivirgaceae bacterium]|nr:methyltransferase [Salinivirgaceae bacterium]HQA75836.1 methyltransferase [Salinivirgaceae bacterium]
MKVGTDGVLLGAWADLPNSGQVLDVGCGTGLISLMFAQRNPMLKIDAIEIDDKAAIQAFENVSISPWKENIRVINDDFFKFNFGNNKYNLIVSNPPFYPKGHKSASLSRDISRNDEFFSLNDFFTKVVRLLNDNGDLAIIFPYNRKNEVENLAKNHGLYFKLVCAVRPIPNKEYHRALVQLSIKPCDTDFSKLVIEQNGRHQYSPEYISLTRDFYLNL